MRIIGKSLAAFGVFMGSVMVGIVLSALLFPEDRTPGWYQALTYILSAAVAVYVLVKPKRIKLPPELQSADRPVFSERLRHAAGLDLPPDAMCSVYYWPDRLSFWVEGRETTIRSSEIRGAERTTWLRLRQQYISGANDSGGETLPALVDDIARQTAPRDKERYLVLTYIGAAGKTKYIIFRLSSRDDGRRLAEAYKRPPASVGTPIEKSPGTPIEL